MNNFYKNFLDFYLFIFSKNYLYYINNSSDNIKFINEWRITIDKTNFKKLYKEAVYGKNFNTLFFFYNTLFLFALFLLNSFLITILIGNSKIILKNKQMMITIRKFPIEIRVKVIILNLILTKNSQKEK